MGDGRAFTLSDEPARGPVRPRSAVLLLVVFTLVAAIVTFVLVTKLGDWVKEPAPSGLRFTNDPNGPGGDVVVLDAPTPAPSLDHLLVEGPACTLTDATGAPRTSGGLQTGDAWVCANNGPFILRWYDGTELYHVTL